MFMLTKGTVRTHAKIRVNQLARAKVTLCVGISFAEGLVVVLIFRGCKHDDHDTAKRKKTRMDLYEQNRSKVVSIGDLLTLRTS